MRIHKVIRIRPFFLLVEVILPLGWAMLAAWGITSYLSSGDDRALAWGAFSTGMFISWIAFSIAAKAMEAKYKLAIKVLFDSIIRESLPHELRGYLSGNGPDSISEFALRNEFQRESKSEEYTVGKSKKDKADDDVRTNCEDCGVAVYLKPTADPETKALCHRCASTKMQEAI